MKTTHFVRDHVMSQAQASQWITGAARHRVGVALRKKKANVADAQTSIVLIVWT
jgi:hypothetical protein